MGNILEKTTKSDKKGQYIFKKDKKIRNKRIDNVK